MIFGFQQGSQKTQLIHPVIFPKNRNEYKYSF